MDIELNIALVTALGIGLLIGIVRERTHKGEDAVAGVRTHSLVAVVGFLALELGPEIYAVALAILGLFAYGSYRVTSLKDPGLTGEVALLVNGLLAGLAHQDSAMAAGLGVTVAALLYAKPTLQNLSRNWLAEGELNDVLMVAAAALVILPMLPVQPLDPWGVVRLDVLWRVVVLIMCISVLGHWAQRLLGQRWGLPVAGFFAGWVSSTAAVASLGSDVRQEPRSVSAAAAAALLANLGSVLLLLGVVGATSPLLLHTIALPIGAGCIGLLACVLALLLRPGHVTKKSMEGDGRAVNFKRAALLAFVILAVSLASAVLDEYLGEAGVLAGSMLVALAELHSAAIGIAQLVSSGRLPEADAQWMIVAILTASVTAKTGLAYVVGGLGYAMRLLLGLGILLAITAAGLVLLVAS